MSGQRLPHTPLVLLLLFAVLAAGCGPAGCPGHGSAPHAPPFQLETLGHGRFYLTEQRGWVLILTFWTTSCQVCKEEMLALERLRGEPGFGELRVAALCADPESDAELRRIAAALALSYPVLLDRGGRVTERYEVSSFPTTLLIDGEGRVRHRWVGWSAADAAALQLQASRLLAEPGAGQP